MENTQFLRKSMKKFSSILDLLSLRTTSSFCYRAFLFTVNIFFQLLRTVKILKTFRPDTFLGLFTLSFICKYNFVDKIFLHKVQSFISQKIHERYRKLISVSIRPNKLLEMDHLTDASSRVKFHNPVRLVKLSQYFFINICLFGATEQVKILLFRKMIFRLVKIH